MLPCASGFTLRDGENYCGACPCAGTCVNTLLRIAGVDSPESWLGAWLCVRLDKVKTRVHWLQEGPADAVHEPVTRFKHVNNKDKVAS